jgi:hypothetical protein
VIAAWHRRMRRINALPTEPRLTLIEGRLDGMQTRLDDLTGGMGDLNDYVGDLPALKKTSSSFSSTGRNGLVGHRASRSLTRCILLSDLICTRCAVLDMQIPWNYLLGQIS